MHARLFAIRHLQNNSLSGFVPQQLGDLPLQSLNLSANQLIGELDNSLRDLPIHNGSSLAGNQFDCPLPQWASLAVPCYCMSLSSVIVYICLLV
jgi:hypothetical protein